MIRLTSLPLSLVGCVNLVKMIVLPTFFYLFKNIPILILKKIFKNLDKNLILFIWGTKLVGSARLNSKNQCAQAA